MVGETVEVKNTQKKVGVWHNGAFIKRWKYWEYVLGIAIDYMIKKYLLWYIPVFRSKKHLFFSYPKVFPHPI